MKKLMIIPVLLLVAALFITCDTKGDWNDIAYPYIPDGVNLLYANEWKVADGKFGVEGVNQAASWTPQAAGSKLILVFSSSADFGWWSGGGVKVGGTVGSDSDKFGDAAANGGDDQNGNAVQKKGFWVLTFNLEASKLVGAISIHGGGPNANPGTSFTNLAAMWIE